MTTTARLLCLLAACSLAPVPACATARGAAKECHVDTGLAPEVAADLATPDYEARLEALVARVGLCIVDRTVESVIAPAGAKADAELVAHGRAWLAAHPG